MFCVKQLLIGFNEKDNCRSGRHQTIPLIKLFMSHLGAINSVTSCCWTYSPSTFLELLPKSKYFEVTDEHF